MLSYQSINEQDDNRLEEVIINLIEKFIIMCCCFFWVFTVTAFFASIYYDIKND